MLDWIVVRVWATSFNEACLFTQSQTISFWNSIVSDLSIPFMHTGWLFWSTMYFFFKPTNCTPNSPTLWGCETFLHGTIIQSPTSVQTHLILQPSLKSYPSLKNKLRFNSFTTSLIFEGCASIQIESVSDWKTSYPNSSIIMMDVVTIFRPVWVTKEAEKGSNKLLEGLVNFVKMELMILFNPYR